MELDFKEQKLSPVSVSEKPLTKAALFHNGRRCNLHITEHRNQKTDGDGSRYPSL